MSDDDAPEEEAAKAEPAEAAERRAHRGRRKRRRAASAEPATESAERPKEGEKPAAEGPDKPAFARDFPADPTLDALVAAFEAGDYARVRREAPALAKATDRDEVRAAARELERRLSPDPLAVYLLGLSALLLALLAGWYWLHPHAP